MVGKIEPSIERNPRVETREYLKKSTKMYQTGGTSTQIGGPNRKINLFIKNSLKGISVILQCMLIRP